MLARWQERCLAGIAGRPPLPWSAEDDALDARITEAQRERVSVGEQPDGTVYGWVGGRYTMLAQGLGGAMRGVETVAPIF